MRTRPCKNQPMANPDRLTGLDSSFLHLERDAAHMHVAGCMVFEGKAPSYPELVDQIGLRLHLVPRYRQRLAFVPFNQGRPVWVDDPHFNLTYHVRHTALPRPGAEGDLKRLAGRIFSQALDRNRPLWELWLVEGLDGGRFALLSKTHHALVDGVSGVDIATVLFDSSPDPMPVVAARERVDPATAADARRSCSPMRVVERGTVPRRGGARRARDAARTAGRWPSGSAGRSRGVGAMAWTGLQAAPPSPFNVRIGPHRRFTWVRGDLAEFKAIKNSLGGTVNDVVLAVVAGALGRYLRRNGHATGDLVLKAMVPVSVRADVERGALGNKVAAMWAPLPVGMTDPVERLLTISHAMQGIKESGQAVGAQVLTGLSGFAPPTIMAQAARLQARQRLFNLVVTNVPGPQHPLYMLGRELEALYPMVPLAENTALGIAIMSYNGQLNFGFTADYDALADVEDADRRPALGDRGAFCRGRWLSRRRAPWPARAVRASAQSARLGEVRDHRARARRDRRRFAGPVLRADRGAVRLLRRPRPGRRVRSPRPARAARSPTSEQAHLKPGDKRPEYDSDPPTSGAHVPEPVIRDEAELNDDQLLSALETGNVVFMYGTKTPPPGLRELANRLASPFTPGARRRRAGRDPRASPGHDRDRWSRLGTRGQRAGRKRSTAGAIRAVLAGSRRPRPLASGAAYERRNGLPSVSGCASYRRARR